VTPLFRDSGRCCRARPDLSASIQQALVQSRYLIVVCSPHCGGLARRQRGNTLASRRWAAAQRVLCTDCSGGRAERFEPYQKPTALEVLSDGGALRKWGPVGQPDRACAWRRFAADAREGRDGFAHTASLNDHARRMLNVGFDDRRAARARATGYAAAPSSRLAPHVVCGAGGGGAL
jgi:hypothetical protein